MSTISMTGGGTFGNRFAPFIGRGRSTARRRIVRVAVDVELNRKFDLRAARLSRRFGRLL